jgi:hypothetical protein
MVKITGYPKITFRKLNKVLIKPFPIMNFMEPQHVKANVQVIAASVIYVFQGFSSYT